MTGHQLSISKKYVLVIMIGIIGLSTFILQNYVIPKDSTFSYYNNFDYTKSLLEKYKTPNDLLNALHNKSISCNDLTSDIKHIVNNMENGICKE